FGLLPGIILHFAFDAFWFAMPLFATTAAGIHVQQFAVIVGILIPVWVVLVRRTQARRAVDLPADVLNAAWPPATKAVVEAVPEPVPRPTDISAATVRGVLVAGAVGAILWAVVSVTLPLQRLPIRIGREDAIMTARRALQPAGLGPSWRFLPV